jgi:hypothetical protein
LPLRSGENQGRHTQSQQRSRKLRAPAAAFAACTQQADLATVSAIGTRAVESVIQYLRQGSHTFNGVFFYISTNLVM